MKTKTRKTTRILCASTIAAMTLLGSVAPALTTVAAEGEVKLPVAENIITFDKKIYLDANENVPNATINYTLEPRTATDDEKTALATAGYHNVVAGTVKLESTSTTFSAADSADKDQGYVSKPATIKASDLLTNLDKPTVFTYTLIEDVQGAAKDFVTTDKGTTRKLNIYVGYKDKNAEANKQLSVLYSTLALENGTKATGFENKYETSDNDDKTNAYKVTKKVTGNQGDKTAKFNFTVTITGQHSKVTATNSGDSKVNATTPTATDSTVKVTTQLKDGESLTLKGLTKGATYTVAEDEANKNGYTTTTETTTVEKTEETVFTNDRTGTIPTGIYLNHKLPFNILGVALAGGAVALIAKKRHEDVLEDEDDE
jgi:hypothetical protein